MFSDVSQHRAMMESDTSMKSLTHLPNAFLVMLIRLLPMVVASNSSLGMDEFSLARRLLPMRSWEEYSPLVRRNLA